MRKASPQRSHQLEPTAVQDQYAAGMGLPLLLRWLVRLRFAQSRALLASRSNVQISYSVVVLGNIGAGVADGRASGSAQRAALLDISRSDQSAYSMCSVLLVESSSMRWTGIQGSTHPQRPATRR